MTANQKLKNSFLGVAFSRFWFHYFVSCFLRMIHYVAMELLSCKRYRKTKCSIEN